MAKDDKRTGPPTDVAMHLSDILSGNGAIDKVSSSLQETIAPAPTGQSGYLSGWTAPYGSEPWMYDGTNLIMLADIAEGTGDSSPYGFTAFNGDLYFSAYDPVHGVELRKLDGDTKEVSLVEDIDTGPGSSQPGMYSGFTALNGDLYFGASDAVNGYQLRKLDGTTGEVSLVDIVEGGLSFSSRTGVGFTVFNGDLYFSAFDTNNGYELHKLDGTTEEISLVSNIAEGSLSSRPGGQGGFIEFNGDLYFGAYDADNGYELRRLDGTTGEVSLAADIYKGSEGSSVGYQGYAVFNGDLYFGASDAENGLELRKLEGTTGEVSLVEDIKAGNNSSLPGRVGGFIEFNGDLYFNAIDDKSGSELRKIDGTTGEVSLAAEINTGSDGSYAGAFSGFTAFNGDLYFSAYDADNGYELRKLDGETGEIDTFEFIEGSADSYASILGVVNDQLVVGAHLDSDGDGIRDRFAMLVSDGEPASVADFRVVDDPSGTFVPGSGLYVAGADQFMF